MGPWKLRLIVHPITISALGLLVLNDHVLKRAWPGVATGKLSDFAGVWLIGALLSALVGSVRLGTTATALAFAALKTVPSVAIWAAPLLGGVTQTDRSDLVALIVLWPLVRLGRALRDYSPVAACGRLPRVGAVLVCVCSVFAASATSCESEDDVGEVRLDADGRVLVQYGFSGEWYVMEGDDPQRAEDAVPVGELTERQCGSEGCFSVRRTGVYLDDDLIFSYSAAQVRQIDKRSGCTQAEMFNSLVVRQLPEGDDVWVAMGMAGVLHRSPDGTWNEIPIFDARPPEAATGQNEGDEESASALSCARWN